MTKMYLTVVGLALLMLVSPLSYSALLAKSQIESSFASSDHFAQLMVLNKQLNSEDILACHTEEAADECLSNAGKHKYIMFADSFKVQKISNNKISAIGQIEAMLLEEFSDIVKQHYQSLAPSDEASIEERSLSSKVKETFAGAGVRVKG